MKTVLTIKGNQTAQSFHARNQSESARFGYTLIIHYADHAFGGNVEIINNVDDVDWLFNIAQGLTGKNSGEVAYDSPHHGFGGCLRFYDYIDTVLLERFNSITLEPATQWAENATGSVSKWEQVEADMVAKYEQRWHQSSFFNKVPRNHRPDLIRAMSLGCAQCDDYPRGYQLCRADDEEAVFAAEQALNEAEYCFWSTTTIVCGVAYFMGFEYGD